VQEILVLNLPGIRESSRLNQPTPELHFLKEPSQFLTPGLSSEKFFYECMQGLLKYLTLKLNSDNITVIIDKCGLLKSRKSVNAVII